MEQENQISEQNIPLLKIQYISLSNFMCFQEETKIFPFDQISGIIGPNGIGKSTIVKAFEFILAKDCFFERRIFDFQFIQNKNSKLNSCKVKLELGNEDQTFIIERILESNNKSKFILEGSVVSETDYLKKLFSFSLSPFNILGQNEKDLFTSMNPKALMEYFERVSGSMQYIEEYQKINNQLKKLQNKIFEKNEFLRIMKKDRREYMFIINSNEKAKQLIDEVEEKSLLVYELNLLFFNKKLQEIQTHIKRYNESKNNCYSTIDELNGEMKSLGNQNFTNMKQKVKVKYQSQLNKYNELTNKIGELERIEQELKNDVKIYEKDLNNLWQPKFKLQEEKLQYIQNQQQDLQIEKSQIQLIAQQKANVKLTGPLKNRLNQFITLGQQRDSLKQENDKLDSLIDSNGEELLKLRSAINKFYVETKEKKDLVISWQNEQLEVDAQLKQILQQEVLYQQEKEINKERERQIIQLREEINSLEIKQSHFITNDRVKEDNLTIDISQRVSSFIGKFGNLIKPIDQKYSLALAQALSKMLSYYVVEDLQGAYQINEILKTREIIKSILILENAPKREKKSLVEIRNQLKQNEYLAIDLLEVQTGSLLFQEYLYYYLRSVVIVEDFQTGIQTMKRLESNKAKIVTIKGEIINFDGVEVHGSISFLSQKIKKFIKFNENTLSKILEEIKEKKKILDAITSQEQSNQYIVYEQQRMNIEKKSLNIKDNIKNMKLIIKQNTTEQQKLEEQLKQREDKYSQWQRQKVQITNDLTQIKEEINYFIQETCTQFKINQDQMNILVTQNKNIEKELMQIDSKIVALQQTQSGINIQEIQDEINNVKQKINQCMKEIDEINEKKNQINAKFQQYSDIENKMRNELETINQQENELNNLKNLIRKKIQVEEQKLEQIIQEEEYCFKNFQHNKIQLRSFLEEEELRGRTIESQIRTQIEEYNTQSGSQDIEIKRLLKIVDFDKYLSKNLNQIEEEVIHQKGILDSLQKKVNGLTVNLDDQEILEKEKKKMEEIKIQLSNAKNELETLIIQEKEQQEQLKEISKLRNDKLKAFVDPLVILINNYYKFVNCNNQAQASLLIENPFQYFQQGIIFSAIPINKHFTIGTESLSSGETSLANLAMFLAINHLKKSSFIILDEIDANLDSENIFKFISSFGKYSKQKQIVFISHKPYVYSHAKMLLGITKHFEKNTAVCYHLNLARLREQNVSSQ